MGLFTAVCSYLFEDIKIMVIVENNTNTFQYQLALLGFCDKITLVQTLKFVRCTWAKVRNQLSPQCSDLICADGSACSSFFFFFILPLLTAGLKWSKIFSPRNSRTSVCFQIIIVHTESKQECHTPRYIFIQSYHLNTRLCRLCLSPSSFEKNLRKSHWKLKLSFNLIYYTPDITTTIKIQQILKSSFLRALKRRLQPIWSQHHMETGVFLTPEPSGVWPCDQILIYCRQRPKLSFTAPICSEVRLMGSPHDPFPDSGPYLPGMDCFSDSFWIMSN